MNLVYWIVVGLFGIGLGRGLIGSIVVAFVATLTLAQINRAVKSA